MNVATKRRLVVVVVMMKKTRFLYRTVYPVAKLGKMRGRARFFKKWEKKRTSLPREPQKEHIRLIHWRSFPFNVAAHSVRPLVIRKSSRSTCRGCMTPTRNCRIGHSGSALGICGSNNQQHRLQQLLLLLLLLLPKPKYL